MTKSYLPVDKRNIDFRIVKIFGLILFSTLALASCGSGSPTTTVSGTTAPSTSAAPVAPPLMVVGQPVMFNVPQRLMLTKGWQLNEPWGTWNDNKVAEMKLTVDPASSKELSLALKSQAFLAKGHASIKVKVTANTVSVATLDFTMKNNVAVRNIDIPASALAKDPGHLHLVFMVDSPASPKSLGVSTDSRTLGIGVVSIELKKAS